MYRGDTVNDVRRTSRQVVAHLTILRKVEVLDRLRSQVYGIIASKIYSQTTFPVLSTTFNPIAEAYVANSDAAKQKQMEGMRIRQYSSFGSGARLLLPTGAAIKAAHFLRDPCALPPKRPHRVAVPFLAGFATSRAEFAIGVTLVLTSAISTGVAMVLGDRWRTRHLLSYLDDHLFLRAGPRFGRSVP